MPNTNDFQPFGTGSGSNVMTAAAWAALTSRLTGFEAGIAKSNEFNTALRQATSPGAMIAKFTADYGSGNVVDDGNIAAFEGLFVGALQEAFLAGVGLASLSLFALDTGVVNAYVATFSPSLAAGAVSGLNLRVKIKAGNTNTGASTFDGGYGPQPILTPLGYPTPPGYIQAGAQLELTDDGAGHFVCLRGGGYVSSTLTTVGAGAATGSFVDMDNRGVIRQGGAYQEGTLTNGAIAFPVPFPHAIMEWGIDNSSNTNGTTDVQLAMDAGDLQTGFTTLSQIYWWSMLGAVPTAPQYFTWWASGY